MLPKRNSVFLSFLPLEPPSPSNKIQARCVQIWSSGGFLSYVFFLFMFASTLGEGGNWVKWMVIGGDCEQQFRSVEKIDLVSE